MQIVFDAQLFTERLSSDKLFQQSVSSMSAETVRQRQRQQRHL